MYQYQRISPYWAALMPPIEPYTSPGIPGMPQQPPQQQIINDNDNINIGSGNQNITFGSPSPVNVTQVTTVTYTALPTDYFLCVDVAAPVTITLPTGTLGAVYVVKDCDGDAAANAITVQGTAGQLVDGSTATINTSYGSISLIFNGTEWSIV